MATIHIPLQGKGGVGKSFISVLMAQKMIEDGKRPLCIDLDPASPTFSAYKSLDVKRFDIMKGEEIAPLKIDPVIELVASSTDDVIIDCGTSSFISLANYIINTGITTILHDVGHTVVIHTVILGGDALYETLEGLDKIISLFNDETKFVVWLNPHHGPIEQGGKQFSEFKVYKKNADRISAVIEIPDFSHDTFGSNLREMFKSNLTFAEALNGKSMFSLVGRQRLTMMRRDIWGRMSQLESIV